MCIAAATIPTGDCYEEGVFHNREDMLPPDQRANVPFINLMRKEAAAVFKQYSELPAQEKRCY